MNNMNIFKLRIPKTLSLVVQTLDEIIDNQEIIIKDHSFSTKFGIYVKPLRKHKLLGKYYDSNLHETIFRLKIKNPNDVIKKNGIGRIIEYNFPIPPKKFLF